MKRFDGNTILIADGDSVYYTPLAETLTYNGATCFYAQDVESGKLLFEIDWCSTNLGTPPDLTCVGSPLVGDSEIYQKYSMADVFSKNGSRRMFRGPSTLLFDFNQFLESLLEIMLPTQVQIEIQSEQ